MAIPTQLASIAAWDDDEHATANRRLYQEKFDGVIPILSDVLRVERPEGGFYLWTDVGMDDERFARELFASQNVTVLPGSYLARATSCAGATDTGAATSPGTRRVRISLVPDVQHCVEAANRIRNFIQGFR